MVITIQIMNLDNICDISFRRRTQVVNIMKKNIIIRADANHSIGMGHIMRTLSIADSFRNAGCNVEFLIADGCVSKLIQDRGYKASILRSGYQKLDDELALLPSDIQADLIIVDSYYVTAPYLQSLKSRMKATGGKLAYIDDVYSFPYPVDVLIDYNAYASSDIYDKLYEGSERPQLIIGPTYAPLRSMFRNVPKKVQNEEVKHILISTGGSDELHLALAILQHLHDQLSREDGIKQTDSCVYHFLLGAMNADKEDIKKVASEDDHIVIHENVTDMRGLIKGMDIAISAAGSTLYEISACGVPLITYSLADNQLPGAEAFERLGLAVNVGDMRDPESIDHNSVMSGILDKSAVERLLTAAEELSHNYERRVKMAKQMQEMIDGFGADRMVQKIMDLM